MSGAQTSDKIDKMVIPLGFFNILTHIRQNYNNLPVFVTENGYSSTEGLVDNNRVYQLRSYLDALLDTIEQGSNVRRYIAWSIVHNFEWMSGYTERFGMYELDFVDPARTRTARKSALVYKEILRSRHVDFSCEPSDLHIDEIYLPVMFCHISGTTGPRPIMMYLNERMSLICITSGGLTKSELRSFPDYFQFGCASASYQVEGSWDEDGKSENIWDHMLHNNPCVIKDCTNGDVATDSYHQYQRDVEMMREMGLDFYRFSLSWTRILPSGFTNQINQAGVEYYNNLIDKMLKHNIQPLITLYHWDLPQRLQDLGGLANPLFVDWFADYARVAYELFGDRVKLWLTFNEPKQICYQGYGDPIKVPLLSIQGIGEYLCARHLLLAHAKAWHIYDDEFRSNQQGENGITVNMEWYEPLTDSDEDKAGANDYSQFEWGQYIHPIFSESGDFPQEMKDNIAARSAAQGFSKSRLPEFSPEEIDYIRGSSDYLGLNHYSTKFIYRNESTFGVNNSPSYLDDINVGVHFSTDYPNGATEWMQVIPWGFYNILTYIRQNYKNPPVFVTENGYSSTGGLVDDDRVYQLRSYLDALLDAIDEGSNVRKYTAWSIMDNFEWMNGYTERFGLYEVDFEDPARTRTARKSALVYKEILRSRQVDFSYEPADLHIAIDEGH